MKGSMASSVSIAPTASTSTNNTNGLPSSLSSSQSSVAPNPNWLSAESMNRNVQRESMKSSLRPLLVLSSGSFAGCSSHVSSIRWAEEVVDHVRGWGRDSVQREERERAKESKKAEQESRRTSEGRKRTLLSDVFPGLSRRSSAASGASGEWGECGGAANVDGGGGDAGWAWVYPPHSLYLPLICRSCMPFRVL
ncbi:hypothetical protein B0H14DRAFT_3420708 [Mycena olivaceomarginata]|nr:hypothetical protein B0H14DRAFT_3420708 [Mycena olivaceomarginata]